jgi:glyoxylase-like metal-dependent hydrolase (beta-lactamase superfamily II)
VENQGLEVNEIFDGIYHISEPAMVCSTLIIGKEKALLFDTGYGTWDLKQTIEKLTNLPIIVVNSHGHGDHINGNYQFNQIYIHKEDIQLAKTYSTPEIKNIIIKTFMEHNAVFPESFSKEEYINSTD